MQPGDKILLGLYRFQPILTEELPLEVGELAWLLDYRWVKEWKVENGFNKYKYPASKGANSSHLERPLKDKARITKVLSVLSAKCHISFIAPVGFDHTFKIQILPSGLLRAEKLDSFRGKIGLWYTDNKNGIIGLIITVLVSVVTALITTMLSK
jgi:hypothetical protein